MTSSSSSNDEMQNKTRKRRKRRKKSPPDVRYHHCRLGDGSKQRVDHVCPSVRVSIELGLLNVSTRSSRRGAKHKNQKNKTKKDSGEPVKCQSSLAKKKKKKKRRGGARQISIAAPEKKKKKTTNEKVTGGGRNVALLLLSLFISF